MLVNVKSEKNNNVKFVKYTGKYPNLCSGELTLEIDGEIVTFGNNYKNPKNYPAFWISGGTPYINNAGWIIDYDEIPEHYRKYAKEIDEIFNENVTFGCCGGCL